MPPDVSVVIPHYQADSTVERAVTSAAYQTWRPKEIIVVDDGSTDDQRTAFDTLPSIINAVPIIRHRLQCNGGPARARNRGWELARGDFIAFLDADDTWEPVKLEIQLSQFADHPRLSLIGHAVALPCCKPTKAPPQAGSIRLVGPNHLLLRNMFPTPSVMLRRSLPFRFDESFEGGEDYDLWLQIVFHGHHAAHIDLDLARLHKPNYGSAGMSAKLWMMERGELHALAKLRHQHLLSSPRFLLAALWSMTKFIKRLVTTGLSRLGITRTVRRGVPRVGTSPLARRFRP